MINVLQPLLKAVMWVYLTIVLPRQVFGLIFLPAIQSGIQVVGIQMVTVQL